MSKHLVLRIAEELRHRPLNWPLAALILLLMLSLISGVWFAPLIILLAAEPVTRLLLRAAYGGSWRRSIFPFSLVDHEEYGFTLRPGVDLRSETGLVFDSFLLRAPVTPFSSQAENLAARVQYCTDARGFRGRALQEMKRGLRIVCSGGSTTAGDKCDDDGTWPARLEANLRGRGIDCEVLNAGVFGWYSFQELQRFRREIVALKPDVVLLHQGWNEEFEYSSLLHGREWKPGTVRSVVEANALYCPSGRLVAGKASVAFHLLARAWMKKFRFTPTMSFQNPERWECLRSPEYVRGWIENVREFAEHSARNGILLFNVDYPCLSTLLDTPRDRSVYYAGSRLTPLFADYQACSKLRISYALRSITPFFPLIDGSLPFRNLRAEERLKLFFDEIHLNPAGNDLLGAAVAEQLAAVPELRARAAGAPARSNVAAPPAGQWARAAELASKNPDFLDLYLRQKAQQLEGARTSSNRYVQEVPSDRYTTF